MSKNEFQKKILLMNKKGARVHSSVVGAEFGASATAHILHGGLFGPTVQLQCVQHHHAVQSKKKV